MCCCRRCAQDLADSKRINSNVKSVPNNATPLKKRRDLVSIDHCTATIISSLFWPQVPHEDFTLPHEVRRAVEGLCVGASLAHSRGALHLPTGSGHAAHLRCKVPLAQGTPQAAVAAQPGHREPGAEHRGPAAGVHGE